MFLSQSARESGSVAVATSPVLVEQSGLLEPRALTKREIAYRLIQTYGYNTTAFFAFNREKQLFLSQNQQGCVSYIVRGNTVVVIGDPFAAEEDLAATLYEFLAYWRQQGKKIAFWQTREELLALYHSQKLHSFKIGEDAMLNLHQFTLKGNKMSNVRSSARRAEKEGTEIIVCEADRIDASIREQMSRISHQWLACKGNKEMGFSMGRMAQERSHEQMVAIALNHRGAVLAFVSFVPLYARNGWALDLLRRAETTGPGVMELLLVRAIAFFQEQGASLLSLGLVPMSNQNNTSLPAWQTMAQNMLRRSSRLQKYESLVFFKNKFRPSWENRYFSYSSKISLLPSMLHVYHAHFCR